MLTTGLNYHIQAMINMLINLLLFCCPPSIVIVPLLNHIGELIVKKNKHFFLRDILSAYIFTSIYLHDLYGDQSDFIAKHATLRVPKTRHLSYLEENDLITSRLFFQIIILEASKPTYQLKNKEWIDSLPPSYQSIAHKFQEETQQCYNDFELGVSK